MILVGVDVKNKTLNDVKLRSSSTICFLYMYTLVHYIILRSLRFPEAFITICSSYFIGLQFWCGKHKHITKILFICVVSSYDAYCNYPVFVLVYKFTYYAYVKMPQTWHNQLALNV